MLFQSRHQHAADLYKNETANDGECRPPELGFGQRGLIGLDLLHTLSAQKNSIQIVEPTHDRLSNHY